MTKHSRAERERRAAETVRVKEIEAAWLGSLPPDAAKAFNTAVAAARARPAGRTARPDGPRYRSPPPRPGREPKPSKEERTNPPAPSATELSHPGLAASEARRRACRRRRDRARERAHLRSA